MNHLAFYISESDKTFWENVIGAVIGTIGAFLVALFAVWADRRKKKSEDNKERRRDYGLRMISAEISLNKFIQAMLRNSRLLKLCATQSKPGKYMTLPRIFDLSSENIDKFGNQQIIDAWLTLVLRSRQVNQNIDDFTLNYKDISDLYMKQKLTNQPLNDDLIMKQYEIFVSFAKDIDKDVIEVFHSAVQVLAILELHLGKKFNTLQEIYEFEFTDKQIKTRIKQIEKEKDFYEIFKDL